MGLQSVASGQNQRLLACSIGSKESFNDFKVDERVVKGLAGVLEELDGGCFSGQKFG